MTTWKELLTALNVAKIVVIIVSMTSGCIDAAADEPLVRIRVQDATGWENVGSGAVIDAANGLVLTCAHSFAKPDRRAIAVEYFDDGKPSRRVAGSLLALDAKADVAIVSVPRDAKGRAFLLAPRDFKVEKGSVVTSFGCSNRSPPSLLSHRVLAVNRYTGPQNLVTTGLQSQGRSGGAMFDTESGLLIGVISATDPAEGSGLSTGIEPVWTLVDRCSAYRPVLYVWTGDWCGPCKVFWNDYQTDPAFRAALDSRFHVHAVKSDKHPLARVLNGIKALPTFWPAGQCARLEGYESKAALLAWLRIAPLSESKPIMPRQPPPPPLPPPPDSSVPPPPVPVDSSVHELRREVQELRQKVADLSAMPRLSGPKGDKGEPGQSVVGPQGPIGLTGPEGKATAGRDGKDGKPGVITVVFIGADGKEIKRAENVESGSLLRLEEKSFLKKGEK